MDAVPGGAKLITPDFGPYTRMLDANTGATPNATFVSESVFGGLMFCGGICVGDTLYFAPNTSSHVLAYDIANDLFYEIGSGLGDFAFKYTGIVAYRGMLYCVPRGVNNILRIDPVTDEVTMIPLDTDYPVRQYGDYRDSHHYNGVISDNGWLYCPPAYGNTDLLKIDLDSFQVEKLPFEAAHSTTWTGCVCIPGNKIVFLGDRGLRVWDCDADTVVADVDAGASMGVYDMVYDPRDGCLYGFGSNKFVKFDPSSYTYSSFGWVNGLTAAYGTVLGIDGRFYTVGPNGTVYAVDKDAFAANASVSTACATEGMTVASAGMVLSNDGAIYSVPGNGKLIKVSFEGATGRLPDCIVSSRYYGKY